MPIGRKINKDDIGLICQYLHCGSEGNRDSWGITNGKKLYTRHGVFKFDKNTKALEVFAGSDYLIGHNRLATQGVTNQPISQKSWIVAHNGVFNDYSFDCQKRSKIKDSDTMLFLKDFVASNKSVKEFMGTVSGSYSMFLANRDTKELYYMRNSPKFTFALLKNVNNGQKIVVGSTSEANIEKNIPYTWEHGFEVNQYEILSKFVPATLSIYKISKKYGVIFSESYEERYDYDNKCKVSDEEFNDDPAQEIKNIDEVTDNLAEAGVHQLFVGTSTSSANTNVGNKQDYFNAEKWRFIVVPNDQEKKWETD